MIKLQMVTVMEQIKHQYFEVCNEVRLPDDQVPHILQHSCFFLSSVLS